MYINVSLALPRHFKIMCTCKTKCQVECVHISVAVDVSLRPALGFSSPSSHRHPTYRCSECNYDILQCSMELTLLIFNSSTVYTEDKITYMYMCTSHVVKDCIRVDPLNSRHIGMDWSWSQAYPATYVHVLICGGGNNVFTAPQIKTCM